MIIVIVVFARYYYSQDKIIHSLTSHNAIGNYGLFAQQGGEILYSYWETSHWAAWTQIDGSRELWTSLWVEFRANEHENKKKFAHNVLVDLPFRVVEHAACQQAAPSSERAINLTRLFVRARASNLTLTKITYAWKARATSRATRFAIQSEL